jgi:hypothetical protein
VALQLVDFAATRYEISLAGESIESNPLMATAMAWWGGVWILAILKALPLLALALAIHRLKFPFLPIIPPLLRATVGVFAVLAMYHGFLLWHVMVLS